MPARRRIKKTQTQKIKKVVAKQVRRIEGQGRYSTPGSRMQNARLAAIRGHGGFFGDLWKKFRGQVPRALGMGIGALAGNPALGHELGAQVSKRLLGWGAYSDRNFGTPWNKDESLMTTDGQTPIMGNLRDHGVRIQHAEYIGPLLSTTAFTNRVFYLNPGLESLFPWLSSIAANFQVYRLNAAAIHYSPLVPNGLATFTSLGKVIITHELNPAIAPCNTQLELEHTKFVRSGAPSRQLIAPIECSPVTGSDRNFKQVRTTQAVPAQTSQLDYDHCQVEVATVGMPTANVQIGDLYITYDITLMAPRFMGPGSTIGTYYMTSTKADNVNMMGLPATRTVKAKTIDVTIGEDGNSITFPTGTVGDYEIMLSWYGTAASMFKGTTTASGSLVLEGSGVHHPLAPYLAPGDGVESGRAIAFLYVSIKDNTSPGTVTFANWSVPTNATLGLHITQCNSDNYPNAPAALQALPGQVSYPTRSDMTARPDCKEPCIVEDPEETQSNDSYVSLRMLNASMPQPTATSSHERPTSRLAIVRQN